MASEDNSDDNIHLDWRDDEVSLVNNTYKVSITGGVTFYL